MLKEMKLKEILLGFFYELNSCYEENPELIPQYPELMVHVRPMLISRHIINAKRIAFSAHSSLLLWQKQIYLSLNGLFFVSHGRFQRRRQCLKFTPATVMSAADLKLPCRKVINLQYLS